MRRISFVAVLALLASPITAFATAPAAFGAAVYPNVAITSPVAASGVAGTVTVTVVGATDPGLTDQTGVLTLLADGVQISSYDCAAASAGQLCTHDFSWDATGLTGAHVLTATMTTTQAASVGSTPVSVSVSSPDPGISIVSPLPGDTVAGTISIPVTSAIDPSQTDLPQSLTLYENGTIIGNYLCAQAGTGKLCDYTFSWDATGLTGDYTFKANLVTVNGVSVDSPLVTVHVVSPPPTVSITNLKTGDTLAGQSSVSFTATVDTTQNDTPDIFKFYVDGVQQGAYKCQTGIGRTCFGSIAWDVTGLSGNKVLTMSITTTKGVTTTSSPITVLVKNPLPTVSITSPVGGAVVAGPISVTVTSSLAASQTDYIASLAYYVDGVQRGTYDCTSQGQSKLCSFTFTWNTSGLNGPMDLTAKVTTHNGVSNTSTPVTVTGNNPGPSVVITTQSNGNVVSGYTSVHTDASIEVHQSDFAKTLNLYADGVLKGTYACDTAGPTKTCSATWNWDATGLSGPHVLQTELVTANGASAFSSFVTVTVDNPPPTVTVTTVSSGDVVSGLVNIHVDGAVDVNQSDFAAKLNFYIDGVQKGTYDCGLAGNPKTCSVTFSWNATGQDGSHALVAEIVTSKSVSVKTKSINFTVSNPLPTVAITTPTSGDVIDGLVNIHVDGAIGSGQLDSASLLTLYIDGTVHGTYDCVRANALQNCGATFSWNTTGRNGAHTFQAQIDTHNGVTVLSTAVQVTVNNPDPTVVIDSPKAADVVNGLVQVQVTAGVDANVLDSADTLSFFVDGNQLSSYNCGLAGFAKSCTVNFQWNAAGLSGTHSLTAQIRTSNGVVITSVPVQVFVFAPSTLTVVGPTSVGYAKTAKVHGVLKSSIDNQPIAGAEVTVVVKPATGPTIVVTATTDASGNYTASYKALANATVNVGWLGSTTYAPATASTRVSVALALSCTAVKSHVRKGQAFKIVCKVPGLVNGLPVNVQVNAARTWHTVVVASAGGTNRTFTYKPTTKGTRVIRVYLPASRLFTKSISKSLAITLT
jgi:hypothetical protein